MYCFKRQVIVRPVLQASELVIHFVFLANLISTLTKSLFVPGAIQFVRHAMDLQVTVFLVP